MEFIDKKISINILLPLSLPSSSFYDNLNSFKHDFTNFKVMFFIKVALIFPNGN